jgi:ParB family transcriptional regulator, chromosome partitioning protein
MSKKSALGKGLSALISDADDIRRVNRFPEYESKETGSSSDSHTDTSPNPASITEIPVDKIVTNPYQPRTTFDEEALNALADSIRQLGLIQPITVRSIGSKYQIISGERRFRAAKLAGVQHIPAYIRKADDQGMLEMAIVENIQREDLNSIEVALSFQRLIEECNLTQEAMADRVGKKRATITNYLRLLKLPAEIQVAVREGKISMGHAKAILSIEDKDKQIKLCNLIISNDLSVRQSEQKVQKISKTTEPKKESETMELPDPYYRVLEIMGRYFNNNISLKRSEKGKGSITIQFASDSEIEAFLKAIEDLK